MGSVCSCAHLLVAMSLHPSRLALILQFLRTELNIMHLQYQFDTTDFLLQLNECRRVVAYVFTDFNDRSGCNALTEFQTRQVQRALTSYSPTKYEVCRTFTYHSQPYQPKAWHGPSSLVVRSHCCGLVDQGQRIKNYRLQRKQI